MRDNTKFGEAIIRTKKNENIYCRSHNQLQFVNAVNSNQITVVEGPAGTGKTMLSALLAVKYLTEGLVDKIIVIRPAVEAGEHLGFLPGTLSEKLDPYLRPIYDVLETVEIKSKDENKQPTKPLKGQKPTQTKQPDDVSSYGSKIELMSIAHARGRSLHNCLPGDTEIVLSDDSVIKIDEIGELLQRGPVFVKTVDINTGESRQNEVTAFIGVTDNELFRFTLDNGSVITCTGDHKLLVNGSYKEAKDITLEDCLTVYV
jgi:hypothetical protein